MDAAVDDLRFAIVAKHEDRRHLALHDAAREDDIDAAAVVEDGDRPPGRAVAGQAIAIIARRLDRNDRGGRNGRALTGRRCGIGPGHGRHVERFPRAQLDHVDAAVGGDDEIGRDVRPRRLHQHMHTASRSRTACRIADDPAGGVAGRDRSRAGQALSRLQRNRRDLPDGGIDLIERAFRPGIDLDGVVVTLTARLDAGGGVGVLDAACRRAGRGSAPRDGPSRRRVQRPRPFVGCGRLHHGQRGHVGIIGELRRAVRGASAQCGCRKQQNQKTGFTENRRTEFALRLAGHWLISRDQLMALT